MQLLIMASIFLLNLTSNYELTPIYSPYQQTENNQQTEKPYIILDNIENQNAFLEFDGQIFQLPIKILPPNAKEGDIMHLEINHQQTSTIKKKATDRIAKIEQKTIEITTQTSSSPINL